jgi:hypothetical protein
MLIIAVSRFFAHNVHSDHWPMLLLQHYDFLAHNVHSGHWSMLTVAVLRLFSS